MAALTSILVGASLAVGAVGAAVSYNQQKQAQRQTNAQIAEQKIEASEAAKLKGTKQSSGASVKLGATAAASAATAAAAKGTATRKSKPNLGGFGVSAAKVGGL